MEECTPPPTKRIIVREGGEVYTRRGLHVIYAKLHYAIVLIHIHIRMHIHIHKP